MIGFFIIISELGRGPLYFLIALGCLGWGLRQGRTRLESRQKWFFLAWRLMMFWVGGVLLNTALKFYLYSPRPWWINSEILPLHPHPASGYGMPSGHTQSAVGIWLFAIGLQPLIQGGRRSSLVIVSLTWVVLIAYSRVYLNEHSAFQVLMGALTGWGWAATILALESHRHGVISFLILITSVSAVCLWRVIYPLSAINLEVKSEILHAYGMSIPLSPPLFHVISMSLIALLLVCGLYDLKNRAQVD